MSEISGFGMLNMTEDDEIRQSFDSYIEDISDLKPKQYKDDTDSRIRYSNDDVDEPEFK